MQCRTATYVVEILRNVPIRHALMLIQQERTMPNRIVHLEAKGIHNRIDLDQTFNPVSALVKNSCMLTDDLPISSVGWRLINT